MIGLRLEGNDFEYEMKMLIKVFYPLDDIQVDVEDKIFIEAMSSENLFACYIKEDGKQVVKFEKELNTGLHINEEKKKAKKILKYVVYRALESYTGKSMPWGMLTGIRPTKIVLELMSEGLSEVEIRKILAEEYCIQSDKIELLVEVANIEKNILSKNKEDEYSLYIGVPFCPTKCLYCSFTSYSSEKYGDQLELYVDALIKEMKAVKDIMKERPIRSVYIGGGTPTSLTASQLERLITCLKETYPMDEVEEFTVEAGRPDSITREKLEVIKRLGATRISINPQTMNQKTLDLVGRRHSVEDIRECFKMARELGFDNINMDIILGLPEESLSHVKRTMDELIALDPENITVHTMAIKRASKLRQLPLDDILARADEVEEMLAVSAKGARQIGMSPYYMYRQKNMVGNFENVGYAKAGYENTYNVEIMEEQESIIALGAGAISKIVFPAENRIERIENVKSFEHYIHRIDEMIGRKQKFFIANEIE